jgi:hypothetical protein
MRAAATRFMLRRSAPLPLSAPGMRQAHYLLPKLLNQTIYHDVFYLSTCSYLQN